jgi:hypothetical protein
MMSEANHYREDEGSGYIPGYSFDNPNRMEHSTLMPEGAFRGH